MVNRINIISHRGRSPGGKYCINTEAECRGFKTVGYHIFELVNRILHRPSVKHKEIFPEVGKGYISHVRK